MNVMKLFFALVVLFIGNAHAAMVVDLVRGAGNKGGTTFTFSDLDAVPAFDGGTYGGSTTLISHSVSGASGSFTVDWTPTRVTEATAWDYDQASPYEIRDFSTGWGISALNDSMGGSGNFQKGEAFLLTFDTSNLRLDAGKSLVFSFRTKNDGGKFKIYKRMSSSSGAEIMTVSTVENVFSSVVPVQRDEEFAVVQIDGINLINGFSIDVVNTIADPGWRVIPEDPTYPSDDVIVAFCSVTDAVYRLPANTKQVDCTAAFQAALDDASAAGGGTVFVPEGTYRINGTLSVPSNVILRGRWREMKSDQGTAGTILSLYSKGTSAIINLDGHGCGVRDLTFWHPDQPPHATHPTVYPFVIAGHGRGITIENINLVNPYNGIDLSRSSLCCLRGIYGSPLHTGLTADRSYMVSRYEQIHFSPDYWYWSGLDGHPISSKGDHSTYMRQYGTAVDIREMDGFYFLHSTLSGYQKGLVLRQGETGDDPWGSIGYFAVTNCEYGLYIEAAKYIKIIGSTFEGSTCGIIGEPDRSIDISLNSCTIQGGIHSVDLSAGSMSLVNCSVTGATHVMGSATLHESSHDPVAPAFNTKYERVRKPSRSVLYNVKDFGAIGDGKTDDTTAIQAAVASAKGDGGGIVLVPDGEYLMTGNIELGAGVELRGCSGGRHITSDRNGEELGSLILIDTGKGDENGIPFITMDDYSGLRGIGFHYVDQNHTNFIAYPFMVQGNGLNNYMIDCGASNPYQAAEFNGDNHLVEYTFLGALRQAYRANNCSGGRIQNCHIKPDFWGDIRLDSEPVDERALYDWEATRNLDVFYLKDCTDYSISSIYNQYAHSFVTVDNSSGQILMTSAERVQHAYTLLNGSKTVDFLLAGCTVNGIGDRTGTHGIKTGLSFDGLARFFAGSLWGTSDETYTAEGGHLYLQQCSIGGFSTRGAMNILCGAEGALSMHSCHSPLFLGLENQGSITMKDCYFSEGLLNAVAFDYEEENTIDKVYLLADLNTDPARSYGLTLDQNNVQMEDSIIITGTPFQAGDHEVRRIKAARLTSGNCFSLDVTDPDFTLGSNPNIEIIFEVNVDTSCTIKTTYDSLSGTMKQGHSVTLNGTDGSIRRMFRLTVDDARFSASNDADIQIEITGGSPQLLMVAVQSAKVKGTSIDGSGKTKNKLGTVLQGE